MKLELALNSFQVGISVILVLALILLVIFGLRYFANRVDDGNLKDRYAGEKGKSPLENRNKYPAVNMMRHSGVIWNVSLALTMMLIVSLFGWTSFDEQSEVMSYSLEIDEIIEVEPPRTQDPPPPPPPPPPSVMVEAVPEELLEEEDVEFMDQSIDEETVFDNQPKFIEPPKQEEAPPPPPPPPPMEEPVVEEIFKVVEEMPSFPGCEDFTDKTERKNCSDRKLYEFLFNNLKYPPMARENGIEGMVYIQFVVEPNGSISNAKIIRDIGAGCGEEALRIVNKMNELGRKWSPGKQRNRPVRVLFTLPIKFQLLT